MENNFPPRTLVEDAFDPVGSSLKPVEIELLQTLYRPAIVPENTAEFLRLRNLGLVFTDQATGLSQLTPLGKSWLLSQSLPGNHQ